MTPQEEFIVYKVRDNEEVIAMVHSRFGLISTPEMKYLVSVPSATDV